MDDDEGLSAPNDSDPAPRVTKEEADRVWTAWNKANADLHDMCVRDGITMRFGARTFGKVSKPKRRSRSTQNLKDRP